MQRLIERLIPYLIVAMLLTGIFNAAGPLMVRAQGGCGDAPPSRLAVGGMAQVTPYLGYGVLFAHVNSQVIDETPYEVMNGNDQKGGSDGSLYTFPTLDWSDNRHTRIFGGIRINIAMIELLYEFDLGTFELGTAKKQLGSHSFKLGFDV